MEPKIVSVEWIWLTQRRYFYLVTYDDGTTFESDHWRPEFAPFI